MPQSSALALFHFLLESDIPKWPADIFLGIIVLLNMINALKAVFMI